MTTITLEPFKEYIAEACGLRFDSGTGEEKLDMALAGRMQESGCTDQVDYLGQLKKDRDEFQRLVNLLTINETYFFREPEQLRLLSQRLIPRLLIRNDGSLPVKILSAGCSSGEEPYSLVISLLERYGESLSRFCSITGVDIDSTVLAKARAGQYGEFSFRGVPEDIRRRYFEKAARGWQLKQEIRSRVTFKELNLLARAMPAGLKDFDLIFFRNVSIYFDEQTRLQIQQNLSSLMKEDGILIVGCSETIANDLGVFRMVEEEGLFYFIKGNPPMPEQSSLSVAFAAQKAKPAPPATDAPLPVLTLPDRWKLTTDSPQGRPAAQPSDLAGLHRLVAENQYDEALRNLDLLLAKEPENPDALLLKGSVLLNRKQFEAVRAIARQVLEQQPWSIDALILLGLAAKWDERPDEAINHFKQAVYACHTCWPAHYHLADCYNRNGQAGLARREYRAVLQLISGSLAETGITVASLGLPASEIRLVSEQQLKKMDSRITE